MKPRTFETWISEFRESIADWQYYCNFSKCIEHANRYRAELYLMNSLLGQHDVEARFRVMARRYPDVIKVIPILLAVHYNQIRILDADGEYLFFFRPCSNTLDEYCTLMRKSGLFDLIQNRLTSNLYDYVLGVEVGLDSHARKNRTGDAMENLVESYIAAAGLKRMERNRPFETGTYAKEMYLDEVEQACDIDLSVLSNEGGTRKCFDFVVHTQSCVYGIETNFYTSSGSKLNETARSYKMLAIEAQDIPGFKFVWFTDGVGWLGARNNLRETFDVLPTLYNIQDMELGICSELFI